MLVYKTRGEDRKIIIIFYAFIGEIKYMAVYTVR